jgi:formylglycine-generating enzyme required for sulfatase activity
MRCPFTIFAIFATLSFSACTPAREDELGRATFAESGQAEIESFAGAAKARWPEPLTGFTYLRAEHFSAGGVAHWMSVWLHESTGLEFVLVPGGEFQMGSPEIEAGRRVDEAQHSVFLAPFLIARTECTQAAWSKFANSAGLAGTTFEGSAQLPVCGFSPAEVDAWCRAAKLNLPTEAQWEFMCRAGTSSTWTMGAITSDVASFANVGSAECPESWIQMGITEPWRDGYGTVPAEVATFACNAFGLFDVHGNLAEWCRDPYSSYELPAEPGLGTRKTDSTDRTARGGNFGGSAAHARSAYRLNVGSGVSPGGNKGFGFRPSLDLPFDAPLATR